MERDENRVMWHRFLSSEPQDSLFSSTIFPLRAKEVGGGRRSKTKGELSENCRVIENKIWSTGTWGQLSVFLGRRPHSFVYVLSTAALCWDGGAV